MAHIEKKIIPEYFDEIERVDKTFELRLADFNIENGDVLVLREWNPDTKEYTGRKLEKSVRFSRVVDLKAWIDEQPELLEKGMVIIQLE